MNDLVEVPDEIWDRTIQAWKTRCTRLGWPFQQPTRDQTCEQRPDGTILIRLYHLDDQTLGRYRWWPERGQIRWISPTAEDI
jgi:hypothetical protein